MKKKVDVSVLMSVYYKEKSEYLKESVESVMRQSVLPREIIIVEDGVLTEELNDTILELQEKYEIIKTVPLKENVQLGRALAIGVETCSCDLIARMDTDDIAVKERIELQYQYMTEHPEVDVLGGYIEEFDDNSEYRRVKTMPHKGKQLLKYAKFRNPMNHMTVMFRKSKICEVGNYRHFPFLEDYELWSRLLGRSGVFVNLECVLVHARTNAGVYDRRGGKKYCRRYMELRRLQKEYGLTNWFEYQIAKLATYLMTRLTPGLRKAVYRKVLRR